MIKHIVMFKLKDRNKENIEKIVDALKTLEGNITSFVLQKSG